MQPDDPIRLREEQRPVVGVDGHEIAARSAAREERLRASSEVDFPDRAVVDVGEELAGERADAERGAVDIADRPRVEDLRFGRRSEAHDVLALHRGVERAAIGAECEAIGIDVREHGGRLGDRIHVVDGGVHGVGCGDEEVPRERIAEDAEGERQAAYDDLLERAAGVDLGDASGRSLRQVEFSGELGDARGLVEVVGDRRDGGRVLAVGVRREDAHVPGEIAHHHAASGKPDADGTRDAVVREVGREGREREPRRDRLGRECHVRLRGSRIGGDERQQRWKDEKTME